MCNEPSRFIAWRLFVLLHGAWSSWCDDVVARVPTRNLLVSAADPAFGLTSALQAQPPLHFLFCSLSRQAAGFFAKPVKQFLGLAERTFPSGGFLPWFQV